MPSLIKYEGLVEQMIAVFPEDSDWTFYRTGISMFRRTNPMFLEQKLGSVCLPMKQK
jgi:hypothetical protein